MRPGDPSSLTGLGDPVIRHDTWHLCRPQLREDRSDRLDPLWYQGEVPERTTADLIQRVVCQVGTTVIPVDDAAVDVEHHDEGTTPSRIWKSDSVTALPQLRRLMMSFDPGC
jgi:hypothetical protein